MTSSCLINFPWKRCLALTILTNLNKMSRARWRNAILKIFHFIVPLVNGLTPTRLVPNETLAYAYIKPWKRNRNRNSYRASSLNTESLHDVKFFITGDTTGVVITTSGATNDDKGNTSQYSVNLKMPFTYIHGIPTQSVRFITKSFLTPFFVYCFLY